MITVIKFKEPVFGGELELETKHIRGLTLREQRERVQRALTLLRQHDQFLRSRMETTDPDYWETAQLEPKQASG